MNATSPANNIHRVFCYGTLKQGFPNDYYLENSTYIGDAQIKGIMFSLGGFPAISLNGDYDIHGEVYDVSDRVLNELDNLEGHPRWYERKQVETAHGPAWVYTMENLCLRDPQFPVVKNGTWYGRHGAN